MIYTEENRGSIQYRDRAKQLNQMPKMRFPSAKLNCVNITPTDIDGMIDYHNKVWIFFELKYDGAEVPYGQKLAFERLIDDLSKIKPSVFILADHYVHDPKEDVYVDETFVRNVYYQGSWRRETQGRKLKEVVEGFLNYNNCIR